MKSKPSTSNKKIKSTRPRFDADLAASILSPAQTEARRRGRPSKKDRTPEEIAMRRRLNNIKAQEEASSRKVGRPRQFGPQVPSRIPQQPVPYQNHGFATSHGTQYGSYGQGSQYSFDNPVNYLYEQDVYTPTDSLPTYLPPSLQSMPGFEYGYEAAPLVEYARNDKGRYQKYDSYNEVFPGYQSELLPPGRFTTVEGLENKSGSTDTEVKALANSEESDKETATEGTTPPTAQVNTGTEAKEAVFIKNGSNSIKVEDSTEGSIFSRIFRRRQQQD